ncbi:unnamed protein product [Rotaria magnacalcarata]|uniref:Uncharacterized protein n=1 Tax=Rotaria magnacalcarata TaxID=392030 RepID=A0A819Y8L2_9BILA|nr:unnamed protein product [Rotaria magnacalcarata]CAF4151234.1 unnamed protein product [Rotaria magnacalcarata]
MTILGTAFVSYYKIYPRNHPDVNKTSSTHEFHNNDSQNDTERSQKYMNQEDASNKTELNTNHDNTQNHEHKQTTNIDEPDHNSNNTEIDNPLLGSNSKLDANTDKASQIEGNTNIAISISNEIEEIKRCLNNITNSLNKIEHPVETSELIFTQNKS